MEKRPIKRTTLCCVTDEQQRLLMILKKRGQGQGKWNMPGGKIAAGEGPMQAAARECREETGIDPLDLQEIGVLEFYFSDHSSTAAWDNICSVFVARGFRGELIAENEECTAHWVPLNRIPYDEMWDDDRKWLPLALKGEPFHHVYRFDQNDHVISEEVK